MGEPDAVPDADPNPKAPSLCEECSSKHWKYRCPGCSIRTCSLPCVNSHKRRTGCSGKRSRTDFVPLSQFDDRALLSDYNLLEETKTAAEAAHRMLGGFRRGFGFKLPRRLWLLRNAANRRRTRLLILPAGMAKRENNQSQFDQRKNTIFWTIEWRFHSADVVLTDHGIDEQMSLHSVVQKHLEHGPWNHQLKQYCSLRLSDLKFFLRKNPKGLKSPYRELKIDTPIGQQLTNVVILEYPVIYVYLPSESYDFEVEKDVESFPENKRPLDSLVNTSSPKGIVFQEEEIEEGEVGSETQVIDLRNYQTSEPFYDLQANKDVMATDQAVKIPDRQMLRSVDKTAKLLACDKSQAHREETNRCSNAGINSISFSEDAKFNFEQELTDAYSDLLGEMNPDDFLCFDDGYSEGEEAKEKRQFPVVPCRGFLGEEELEEGEILG